MTKINWPDLLVLPVGAKGEDAPVGKLSALAQGDVQPCGRAFHMRQFNIAPVVEEVVVDDAESAGRRDELRSMLDKKGLKLTDYYALMGLEEQSWRSSVEQIQENWKIISFICHPDKSTPETRPYGETRFKAMQLAFSTLTDKKKRIGYDSALPFDEKIPKDKQGATEETFYSVYGPVFDRNSRFSIAKPAPALGDASTSDEAMLDFYDFWFGFQSWRDFTHLDEHKNDDSTDRHTKRENERKNAKLRAGAKKDEMGRMRKLTEDAQNKDPRVKRHRQKVEDEKKAKKNARKNAMYKKDEPSAEKVKADAEAKAIADAAAAAAQSQVDSKKKAGNFNKEKKKLPKLCKSERVGGPYEAEEIAAVVGVMDADECANLIVAMSLHSGANPPPYTDAEKAACRELFDLVLDKTPLGPARRAAQK